ncbi:MAG: hypothetical protein ABI573_02160 [Chloroflexota bacterium]
MANPGGDPGQSPQQSQVPPIGKIALATAAGWLIIGGALSGLASSAPHPHALIPQLLAYLALLIGWPIGRWVGRRNGLVTRGEWVRMWAMTAALLFVGLGFVACAVALATYG